MDLQVDKSSNPQDVPRLQEGERVEVRQKDVGLRGSWHPGTIVGLKAGRRLVQYDELLTDDGLTKLRESIPCAKLNEKPISSPGPCTPQKNTVLVPPSTRSPFKRRGLLRPSPPICTEPSPLTWKGGLYVDVFYQDAWWEAVLLSDVTSLDEDALIDVIYPDEGDLARVHAKNLRISQYWDEVTGEWTIKGSIDLRRFLKRRGIGRKEVALIMDSECRGSEGGILQNSFMQGEQVEVTINETATDQLCVSPKSKRGGENALAAVMQGSAAVPSSGNEVNKEFLPLRSHRHLLSDRFSTDEDMNQKSLPLACSRNGGMFFDPSTSKGQPEISRCLGRSEHTIYERPQHSKSIDGNCDINAIGSGKEILEREDIGECTSSLFAKEESIYDNLRSKRRRIGEAHANSCEREVKFSGSQPTSSTPRQNHQLETFQQIQEESSLGMDRSFDRGSTSYSGVVHDKGLSNLEGSSKCSSAMLFQKEAMQQSFVSKERKMLQKETPSPFPRGNFDCENVLENENKSVDPRPVSRKHLLALEAPAWKSREEYDRTRKSRERYDETKKHLLALEAPARKSREEYDQITSAGKSALEGGVQDRVVRSVRKVGKGAPAQKSLEESNQITVAGKLKLEMGVLERGMRSGRRARVDAPVQKLQKENDRITSAGKETVEGGVQHMTVVRLAEQAKEISRSVCKAERRGRKEDTLRSFRDQLVRQKQADALKRKASKMSSISEMDGKNGKLLKASKPCRKPDQTETKAEAEPATALGLPNCEDRSLKSLTREIGKKAVLEAGFTIEYKLRRGKLSHDAIYTSPKGRSYWSLPRAWEALGKEERRKGRIRVEKDVIQQVLSKIDNDESLRSDFEKLDKFSGTCLLDVIRQANMTYAELTDVLVEDLRVLRKNMPNSKCRKLLDGGKQLKIKAGKNTNICPNPKKKADSKTSLFTSESFVVERRGRKRKQQPESFSQDVDCKMLTSKVSSRIKCLQGGSLPKLEKKRLLLTEGTSKTSNHKRKSANKALIRPASSLIGASIEKSRNISKASIKNNGIDARASRQESSRKKEKPRSGFRLEVRPSSSSMDDASEDLSCQSKRTVASWMIDRGAVLERERIFHVDQLNNKILKEGVLTREGIFCRCCKKIYTIHNFEEHGGSHEEKSQCNLIFTSGRSFLDCLLEAWNAETQLRKTHNYKGVTASDTNDDTCLLCGDGGVLLCCDLCPSTFHASCLQLDNVPEGTWYCPKCQCGVCRNRHSNEEEEAMAVCSQCERRYHISCLRGGHTIVQKEFFCGRPCKKIYSELRKLVGITHSLDRGFSWTLLRCMEEGDGPRSKDMKLAMENNSKLAVALLVLKECFNPMDDPRTNIDMITHALYNRWSQFDRLNYVGFYTAVLERDDEIISVASIRIHGAQVAEMPLIGTRHKYRRQGMCRLLVGVIEKLLCSLEVATFILPAISELFETWTQAFGFRPLDTSQKSQIKELSMMMFPGTDLLQKSMLGSSTGKAAVLQDHVSAELPQSADAVSLDVCQKLQDTGSSRAATIETGLLHNTRTGSPRGGGSLDQNPDLDLLPTDDGDDDMFFDACQNLQSTDSSMMAEMGTGSQLNSSSGSPTGGGLPSAEVLVIRTKDRGSEPSSDFWQSDEVLGGDGGSVKAESSLDEARDGGSWKSETNPIQTDLASFGGVWSPTAEGTSHETRDAEFQNMEQSLDCMQIDGGTVGSLTAEGILHEASDDGSQQLEPRSHLKKSSLSCDGLESRDSELLELKQSSPECMQTDSAEVVERVTLSHGLKPSSDCVQTDSVLRGGGGSLTVESTLGEARICGPLRPERSSSFLGSDFASLGGCVSSAAEFLYIEGRHAISQKAELSSDSASLNGGGSPIAEGNSLTDAKDSGLGKLELISDPVQTDPIPLGGAGSLITKGALLEARDGDMQKLEAASESNQTDLPPCGGGSLTIEGRSFEKGTVVCRS